MKCPVNPKHTLWVTDDRGPKAFYCEKDGWFSPSERKQIQKHKRKENKPK